MASADVYPGKGPHPAAREIGEWLTRNLIPEGGAALIHNDFKLNNIIWDAGAAAGGPLAPVALLMGVEPKDITDVGSLLGTKLVANEFVAYAQMTSIEMQKALSPRSIVLATYALTGFANVASIGIQLGGIGALARERRGDLARLGGRALLTGFTATLINASIAGLMIG